MVSRARTHVYVIDGTMSRLALGEETNAGLLYKLVEELGPRRDQTVGYHPGVQSEGLGKWIRIAAGVGINLAIIEGYATLASRYRPGDAIMLFGFSRGAYAVRSLAGFIANIGLVRQNEATERMIARAFRLYETPGSAADDFRARHCHDHVPIAFLGVWDTVKALGLPYPLLSRLAPMASEFHDEGLAPEVENAFQALALDEDRAAYTPMPWRVAPDWEGRGEQMWFAGAHADVGGHVYDAPASRPLSNIPLRWMIEHAAACGLILPNGWQTRYPVDPLAPAKGNRRGHARLFWDRAPRVIGACSSEAVHASVAERMRGPGGYLPRAREAGEAEVTAGAAVEAEAEGVSESGAGLSLPPSAPRSLGRSRGG
ncbi:DUF2235 domain-containing protein [soil metagenome]